MESKQILKGTIWLEIDDEKVLSQVHVELLERVHKSGYIRQGALQMRMSYKHAWDLIHHMNDHHKLPIVISQRGGKGGGCAIVTAHGIRLVGQFHLLKIKFQDFLDLNIIDVNC